MSATDQPLTVSVTPARTSTTTAASTNAVPAELPGVAEPNPELSGLAGAVAVAHRVAVLAETDPNAPLVVAVRAALEVADARRAAHRDRRIAGLQVHGGDSSWWACWAEQWLPYAEMAALRATPGPDANPPAPAPDGETDTAGRIHESPRPDIPSRMRRGDRR